MTQQFSTNTGIAATPEFSQSQFPGIYLDSLRLRQGIKILQSVLDTYTGALGEEPTYWNQVGATSWNRLANLTRTYAQATEYIVAGAMVNFYSNAGVLAVRNANASAAGRQCHAFSNGIVNVGAYGEFIQQGICYLVGGLTPGITYYLSNTDGLIANAAGTISQKIGYAMGPNILVFRPDLV